MLNIRSIQRSIVGLTNQQVRFAHVPMIKFIGKRHPKNVHLNYLDTLPVEGQASSAAAATGTCGAISPNCDVEFDTSHKNHERRLQVSQEEMDIINQGTNECYGWENITL